MRDPQLRPIPGRVMGIESHGFCDQFNGRVRLAGSGKNKAQCSKRVRPIGVERERLSNMELGLIVLPTEQVDVAEGRMTFALLRIENNCLCRQFEGAVKAPTRT